MKKKSEALLELEKLAAETARKKFPNIPEHALPKDKYSDSTANELTKSILAYLHLKGHAAWRQASEGRYRPGKQYTDVIGRTRLMKGMYLPGTNVGQGDIASVIEGHFVSWEVKMKDKQSDGQKRFQQQIEQSKGIYYIAHNFNEFMEQYKKLMLQ